MIKSRKQKSSKKDFRDDIFDAAENMENKLFTNTNLIKCSERE